MAAVSSPVPPDFTIITSHTSIATGGGFNGFVIARAPGRAQGIVVWLNHFDTRAVALRHARKQAATMRGAA